MEGDFGGKTGFTCVDDGAGRGSICGVKPAEVEEEEGSTEMGMEVGVEWTVDEVDEFGLSALDFLRGGRVGVVSLEVEDPEVMEVGVAVECKAVVEVDE